MTLQGFFQKSQLTQSKAPIPLLPRCGECGLFKNCNSPKMEVSGKGKRKILLIGEAPGIQEDKRGKQFVGETGQFLERTLRKFGIDMQKDCWLTNSLICFPPDGNGKWRKPTDKEVGFCRPNLIKTIKELEPEIIVPLGDSAVNSLIGWVWKDEVGTVGRWIGWQIPHQKLNCWICPAWHPSYVSREGYSSYGSKRKNEVVIKIWQHHLKQISKLEGRPWEKVPDYKSQVELIYDHKEAARIIDQFIEYGGTAAFDFETNMLKPDWPDARIVSCSICWEGKRTIAFPWAGKAIEAMKRFCTSPIRKIASNLKFESRWCRAVLGTTIRSWWHDTMLAAHIQDNRKAITGLKFQAFIWLGAESYDDHIKGLLKSKGDDRTNQVIKEIDLKDLLTYNGMDSLLEYHTCFRQRKVMGYDD